MGSLGTKWRGGTIGSQPFYSPIPHEETWYFPARDRKLSPICSRPTHPIPELSQSLLMKFTNSIPDDEPIRNRRAAQLRCMIPTSVEQEWFLGAANASI